MLPWSDALVDVILCCVVRPLKGFVRDNDSERPLLKNPSLGLKLGHVLVKCADKKGYGYSHGGQGYGR